MSDVPSPLGQRVIDGLSPDLGVHTATQALKLACKKAKCEPAELDGQHLESVSKALRPMLRTLVGRARTDRVLDWIGAELPPPRP